MSSLTQRADRSEGGNVVKASSAVNFRFRLSSSLVALNPASGPLLWVFS